MRVWLIKVGESLPLIEGYRSFRMDMLANSLVKQGHQIVWWTSAWDNKAGKDLVDKDTRVKVQECEDYQVHLLKTRVKYHKAVSVRRLLNNITYEAALIEAFNSDLERPDMIVCAMPAPGLAYKVAKYALRHDIPYTIDVRDMWPDIFSEVLQGWKRFLSFPVQRLMAYQLRFALTNANKVISITDSFLQWALTYSQSKVQQSASFPLGAIACVSDSPVDHAVLEKYGITEQYNVLYFAGTLNSTTLLEHLLPVLQDSDYILKYRLKVVICGDGDDAAYYRKLFASYSDVIFTGHVEASVLKSLRQIAFAAWLPIQRRRDYMMSYSNKVCEYLSCGLPLVSHLTGEVGKLIERYYCGVVYADGAELKQKLAVVLEDKDLLKELTAGAHRAFDENLNANIIYPKLVGFITHL